MSSTIDPDDYAPSAYRDITNQVVDTIDAAIDADGLNAAERAQLVELRREAMRILNFREPVPDTIPLAWTTHTAAASASCGHPECSAQKDAERERALAEKRAWRRASIEQRDELVLSALPDTGLTVWEVAVEMYRRRAEHGAYCTQEALRTHLKSMETRGVVSSRQERREVSRGRTATCWYPVSVSGAATHEREAA